ncbi:DUF4342 domain-containing protein [bacterium]|nr:DUF4342 domain-containing protein [bacterium]
MTDRADGDTAGDRFEEFQVEGENLVGRVRELIREGNVRHVVITGEDGATILEIPVTVGVIGAVLLPLWVAVGAVAAMVTNCTIKVERRDESEND